MPAGREMDALLAEKVMGWGIEVNPIFEGGIGLQVSPGTTKAIAMFAPSTDIAAAWEVLNKLTHKEPCINYLNDLWNPVGWHCHIDGHHAEGCDTAPLAICRCALKVAGVEI